MFLTYRILLSLLALHCFTAFSYASSCEDSLGKHSQKKITVDEIYPEAFESEPSHQFQLRQDVTTGDFQLFIEAVERNQIWLGFPTKLTAAKGLPARPMLLPQSGSHHLVLWGLKVEPGFWLPSPVFVSLKLYHPQLHQILVTQANWHRIHIFQGDLSYTILNGKISNSSMIQTDMRFFNQDAHKFFGKAPELEFEKVQFKNAILVNSFFEDSRWSEVTLENVDSSLVTFNKANLNQVHFKGSSTTLIGAKFEKTSLSRVSFQGRIDAAFVNFKGAQFTYHTDLRGLVLHADEENRTHLEGATYDDTVILPDPETIEGLPYGSANWDAPYEIDRILQLEFGMRYVGRMKERQFGFGRQE